MKIEPVATAMEPWPAPMAVPTAAIAEPPQMAVPLDERGDLAADLEEPAEQQAEQECGDDAADGDHPAALGGSGEIVEIDAEAEQDDARLDQVLADRSGEFLSLRPVGEAEDDADGEGGGG